ncbi:MAG: Gfo/Idh/MocA family oxidoreductase [Ruminococcaceae bacterium]|nr:Gfo/Idh/MocA family oxidoreductase [Oscillospiraceae bacterium]
MKKKLRVGLYGSYGHQIHYKLYNNEEAELVALCEVSDSFFSEIKEHCSNIILYSSLEEMLKDKSIDLISLCSPKRSQQEKHAIMCLKEGKHVYAEKPAAFSEDGLERILTAAKENGCEFHEMADSVFVEPYWTVRKLVKSGKIGEVIQVYVQKSYPLNIDNRPQDEETDGGLVRQAGIHAIRFLEHITDLEVESVNVRQTHLGNINPNEGLYTASSWLMTLSNGGVASACVNYLNPKGFGKWGNESIRIFGTEGMVEITDGGRRTHLYTHSADEGEIDTQNSDCVDYFKLLTEHLLYGNDMPLSQDEELHPLRVVIRAFDSAEKVEITN